MNDPRADTLLSKERPLDGIQSAANRVEAYAERINDFISRLRGDSVAETCSGAPTPCGHLPQLSRLHSALDQMEKLTSDLTDLG